MKITTLNNAEIVIQARNEADYLKALKVAEEMTEIDSGVEVASVCECEWWIHLCAVWDNKQAAELKELYKNAKNNLK